MLGLGTRAAAKRLEVFGFNLNPFMLHKDPSHSTWPILSLTAHTLASGLLSMGIYAALSIIGGHWWQFGGMVLLVSFFLVLAWFHTLRWRSLMRHMKKMLILRSSVLRDGIWKDVPSRELVPGDIIQLAPGKIVPARCVVRECSEDLIVDSRSVLTDKLILTDISETVDQGVMQIGPDEELLAGSMIKSGEAYRVQVLTTGPDAFIHHSYDDGLVSNLRRTRRKDLVYSATRSLIMLVALTFVIAVGAALLTAILSDRQLAQVLATATFLIVFVAVHNPVGLILRYARTEGARRVALSKGKRIGAAMHTLTTVELLAAIGTLAIDVRGFLASSELKVTKMYPMKQCTASGMLIAAALATTPESQAASSPLSPHRIAPVGDMEPINMAILEELHVHNERKFGKQVAVTDDALIQAPLRQNHTDLTEHRKEGSSSHGHTSDSNKKKSKKRSSAASTPLDNDISKSQPENQKELPKKDEKRANSKKKKKVDESSTDEQPSDSTSSQGRPKNSSLPNATTHIEDSSSSTFDDSSERTAPRHKRPRTNSALRHSAHHSTITTAPTVNSTSSLRLPTHTEQKEPEGASDEQKKDTPQQSPKGDRKGDASDVVIEMTDMTSSNKDRRKKKKNSAPVDAILSDDIEDCEAGLKGKTKKNKRSKNNVELEMVEHVCDSSPLPLVHSSSSIQAKSSFPYSGKSSRKPSMKGKDPCLSSVTPYSESPMELANYTRLGALFPPGCTIVHLQAHSEESIKYARESNPLKPDTSSTETIEPLLVEPKSNGLKMETMIKRDGFQNKSESSWAIADQSSSTTKTTSSLTSSGAQKDDPAYPTFLVAKGDPRSVIRLCVERDDEALVNKVDALVKTQCERGHSVVAIAKGPAASLHILEHGPPNNMNLVGLICFDGKVLPDTSASLVDAYMMGLNVKLITNDSVPTGAAFANKIGMGSNVVTIEDYLANDPHLGGGKGIDLNDADGFAEVTPENRIHLALAASGISQELFVDPSNTTGKKKKTPPRTLWGITSNDPSVLYETDVGITSCDESDVAIQSADVVLMRPGLKALVRAIKKARQTLSVLEALAMMCAVQSIRNIITLVAAWVTYGFQPIPTTSLTILVALNLPMLLVVAQFERGRASSKPPSPFLIRRVSFNTFAITLFEVIAAFLMGVLVYDVRLRRLSREQANTTAFLWFGLANGFIVLLCRSPAGLFWKKPWPHPITIIIVVASQLTASILSIFGFGMAKIGFVGAALVWAFAAFFFCIQLLVFYATRIIWKRHIEVTLHSDSWFMVWHKRLSQSRWYRGLLTG